MEIAVNPAKMQNLNALMNAARARNGFTGAVKKDINKAETPKATPFIDTLKKITTKLSVPVASTTEVNNKVVKEATLSKIEKKAPLQTKRNLGNYVDVMA